MGRPELAVGCRDLEVGRLVAGVRLETQLLEPELRIDREVGESLEVVTHLVRERARRRPLEPGVLARPLVLDGADIVEVVLVLVLVPVVVLVLRVVVPRVLMLVLVFLGHPSALPTTACASSMIRSRWSSPRKLSA